MTTFLLLSSVAINIMLIVAHKRLNNWCEKLELDLNREHESNNLWREDYDASMIRYSNLKDNSGKV